MFIDCTEREEFENDKLARMHPVAYEAKMKARVGWDLIGDIIKFFKKLLAKKVK